MIKNNIIRIKTHGCRKKPEFRELGYDVSSEYIDLKIEHLNTGSREIVEVICDYCNSEVNIFYKEYLRNISKGGKYACSRVCGVLKVKETNILKYGVAHPMMLKETQDKAKKTNLERYGVEYLQQSTIMQEKSKETCLEKYGVDHISKTEFFKKKVIETCLEKYGNEYYMSSDDFKEKSKTTLLENYGVINPNQSLIIQNKIKENNLKKHGVDHTSKLDIVKIKNKLTTFERYGVDNITKCEKYRENRFDISSNTNYIYYINNTISLFKCDKNLSHNFEISSDNYYHRMKSNIPLCTVCNPIGEQKSIKEKELFEYIKSIYSGEIIQSYRDELEIDIYLPELKIGFEFNGLYWHSSKFKDRNYHLNKTNFFKEKDIRIIHIYEDNYNNNLEIIKSQITNLLGSNNNRIFARKCYVKEIKDSKICTNFLNENHIQGKVNSNLKLGLYHGDDLVSLMTFDRFEGRLKMEEGGWNLNRFCNIINTSVVGSASKLLTYFIKNYDVSRIVSYADKDWSIGKLYETLGFEKISESSPDYKYIVDNKRVHKSRYKKDNLNLEDKTKTTEKEEMLKRNIFKIYDCGKIKYQRVL